MQTADGEECDDGINDGGYGEGAPNGKGPGQNKLYLNDGKGRFTNVSDQMAPGLKEVGLLRDMQWADVDNDGDLDLVTGNIRFGFNVDHLSILTG